jgi:hypothetical protein
VRDLQTKTKSHTEISILHLGSENDIPYRSDKEHRSNQDAGQGKVIHPLPPRRPFIARAPRSHRFIVRIELGRGIGVRLGVVRVHGTRWVLRLARAIGVREERVCFLWEEGHVADWGAVSPVARSSLCLLKL